MDLDVTSLHHRRAVHRWERMSVGDLIERVTWSRPDKLAIVGRPGAYADERMAALTYRQADELANQVAHALLARGLSRGDVVLLFCENSVEALLAKIGIVSSLRVEAVLAQHPDVAKAAVIGLPHPRWSEAVTAVVVLRDGAVASEDDLIKHCRAHLAGYETPKSVVFAADLPETVGGKVLKYRLRAEHAGHYREGGELP